MSLNRVYFSYPSYKRSSYSGQFNQNYGDFTFPLKGIDSNCPTSIPPKVTQERNIYQTENLTYLLKNERVVRAQEQMERRAAEPHVQNSSLRNDASIYCKYNNFIGVMAAWFPGSSSSPSPDGPGEWGLRRRF